MAPVRVYQFANNPVRVFIPNAAARLDGEDDATFLSRLAAVAEANDTTLARSGTQVIDIDDSELPTGPRVDTAGPVALNVRASWRIAGNSVISIPANIQPLNGA